MAMERYEKILKFSKMDLQTFLNKIEVKDLEEQ